MIGLRGEGMSAGRGDGDGSAARAWHGNEADRSGAWMQADDGEALPPGKQRQFDFGGTRAFD
jgi:hypothetical protein